MSNVSYKKATTSVDVCITSLIAGKQHKKLLWGSQIGAHKWSELITQSRFDSVRDSAKRIYDSMLAAKQLCPEVQWDGKELRLIYKEKYIEAIWVVARDVVKLTTTAFGATTTRLVDDAILSLEQEANSVGTFMNGDDDV